MAKKLTFIACAILCAFDLDGKRYTPGQVVEFETGVANDLADQGSVDKHKNAVAYEQSRGAKAIRHPHPDDEAAAEPPTAPTDPNAPAAAE